VIKLKEQKPYRILLFYKYVDIEDPQYFAKRHLKFCKELGVKGRIIVATEGINGTISGTIEQTDKYMRFMHENPLFHDMWFKIDQAGKHAFDRISVKPRKEIVTLNLENDLNPNEKTGKHLTAKEFHEAMQDEGTIIIDARNDYEFNIGHFRNAIRPDVRSFRELPKWIQDNLSNHKDKKILTYCTGGIRCEKFSGWLLEEGFEDVNQLHGGIVSYGKDPELQGKLWEGKCFVFDDRISVPINQTDEKTVVGECHHCGNPEDRYINCKNPDCDKLHIACGKCEKTFAGYCCDDCQSYGESQL
jgi:UPF0176 protein